MIEIDDDGSMAYCTKEAIAERLDDLGRVRVLEVTADKPEQMTMI